MCSITEMLNEYPKKNNVTLAEISDRMGASLSTLGRKLNPYDEKRGLAIYELVPFITACNNDLSVLDHIESIFGRRAVTVNAQRMNLDAPGLGILAKEAGEAISEYSKAIAAGEVKRDDAMKCIKEFNDLISVAMGLTRELHKIIE